MTVADDTPTTDPTLPGTDVAPEKPKRTRTRAPRKRAPRKPTAERKPRAPRKAPAPRLGPRIEMAHVVVGGLAAHTVLPKTGTALAQQAQAAGEFWERAAATNPRIREVWERFLTAGLTVQAFAVYAPVVVVMLGELHVIGDDRAQLAAGLLSSMAGATVPAETTAAPGRPANVADSAAGDAPPAPPVVDLPTDDD